MEECFFLKPLIVYSIRISSSSIKPKLQNLVEVSIPNIFNSA